MKPEAKLMKNTISKEDKYVDMIVDEITDKFLDAISFKEILELMPHGELTKEALVNVIDCYDIYTVYHMIFDLFGYELTKEEYMELKSRYIKTFDLDFVPLPDCCEELDKKWGLKNV